MRLFKDFIAAIQRQSEFDPEAGNIVELMYRRQFVDDEERLLACKFAYVRAFHERKPFMTENNVRAFGDVFWVLPDDCTFAMEADAFVPVGIEQLPPEGAIDAISLNYGLDFERVAKAQRYSERINYSDTDRCVFYKIETEPDVSF